MKIKEKKNSNGGERMQITKFHLDNCVYGRICAYSDVLFGITEN